MPIHGRAKSKDFTPAPEGLHRAVCCDVVNLGMQETKFGRKHMILIVFQAEEKMPDGKPFLIQKRYTLSMHKKANLRRDVESWRGKPFASDEEAEELDLEKLIAANAQVNVSHNTTDAGTFANIQAIVPPPRGLPLLKIEDYTRRCERPDWEEPELDEEEEYRETQVDADDEVPF